MKPPIKDTPNKGQPLSKGQNNITDPNGSFIQRLQSIMHIATHALVDNLVYIDVASYIMIAGSCRRKKHKAELLIIL